MVKKQQKKSAVSSRTAEKSVYHLYLQEISKIAVLSHEEEIETARRVKRGDTEARDRLIRSNLRFVVTIARRYQAHGMGIIDLINEGNLGLLKAVERFDPEMGIHFINFAVWSIRQAITQAIQQKSHLVRMPANQVYQLRQILKVKESIEDEDGRQASLALLANILHVKLKNVKHLLEMSQDMISLDKSTSLEKEVPLLECIADKTAIGPEEILEEAEMKHQLNQCLLKLSSQEREVLQMRYGLGRATFSLKKIGLVIGLSRERIRQIEIKAIRKLRETEEGQRLFSYLQD